MTARPFFLARLSGLESLQEATRALVGPARHSESGRIYQIFLSAAQGVVNVDDLSYWWGRVLPGVYRHYKSTPQNEKVYRVLGPCFIASLQKIAVLYVPLYTTPEQAMALRPYDGSGGWLTPLEDGRSRFSHIAS